MLDKNKPKIFRFSFFYCPISSYLCTAKSKAFKVTIFIYNRFFKLLFLVSLLGSFNAVYAQHEGENVPTNSPSQADPHEAKSGHGETEEEQILDVGKMIIGHITDGHEFHMTPGLVVPLPCIVYHKEKGFDFFMSSVFHHGHEAHNGYVMNDGVLNYVDSPSFPQDATVAVGHITENKATKQFSVEYNAQNLPISRSSFYDFSITRTVFTMLLTALIMLVLFPAIAGGYKKSQVPTGVRGFFEPIIQFIRDDVAVPNLGDKVSRYLPFLLTVFFFIWFNNLLGLIPFFPGGGNVMGNIAVTATLAVITFLITTFSGNKNYWGHIFNPPGIPGPIKPMLILIEFLSIFVKPFALALRLFANITAGHIIILSFVAIIFIVNSLAGSAAGFGVGLLSGAFMIFLNILELFVGILQAYIFTVLSAVFIGQAIEEHHHEAAH